MHIRVYVITNRKRRAYHFDGDLEIRPQAFGLVDAGEAALAQQMQHLVVLGNRGKKHLALKIKTHHKHTHAIKKGRTPARGPNLDALAEAAAGVGRHDVCGPPEGLAAPRHRLDPGFRRAGTPWGAGGCPHSADMMHSLSLED